MRHGGSIERLLCKAGSAKRGLTGNPSTRSRARGTPARVSTLAVGSLAITKQSAEQRNQIALIVIESVIATTRFGREPFTAPKVSSRKCG